MNCGVCYGCVTEHYGVRAPRCCVMGVDATKMALVSASTPFCRHVITKLCSSKETSRDRQFRLRNGLTKTRCVLCPFKDSRGSPHWILRGLQGATFWQCIKRSRNWRLFVVKCSKFLAMTRAPALLVLHTIWPGHCTSFLHVTVFYIGSLPGNWNLPLACCCQMA